jgi:hypothetical protein
MQYVSTFGKPSWAVENAIAPPVPGKELVPALWADATGASGSAASSAARSVVVALFLPFDPFPSYPFSPLGGTRRDGPVPFSAPRRALLAGPDRGLPGVGDAAFVAAPAVDGVLDAVLGVEPVAARATEELVGPRAAEEDVRPGRAGQGVRAVGAGDVLDTDERDALGGW